MKPRKKTLLVGGLVFLWPFVYYYRLIIPKTPISLSLGNDFIHVYFKYKLYLLDMLAGGQFPLWSPFEAAGCPFYSSPFTQTFYPLNILLLLFYKVSGRYSAYEHQVFTVLGLSIYGLGLYLWLRRITINQRAVLFAVLVVVSSFKLGDILRFTNAVHTAAWMPWMLYGLTLAIQKGNALKGGMVLFGSSIMMLTGGYIYYIYHNLFLAPVYAIVLLFPGGRKALFERETGRHADRKRFVAVTIGSVAAALTICSPYFYKMFQLVKQTVRGGVDYDFSTSYEFGPIDTLGSLIYPPAAQTEGWYYFSILGVLLVMLLVIRSFSADGTRAAQWKFLAGVFIWMGLITYITYGRDSYLFDFLWNYFPGFARIRVWGRLNIVLLPAIALLLARSYGLFEQALSGQGGATACKRPVTGFGFAVFTGAGLIVVGLQLWLYTNKMHDLYWLACFKEFHGTEFRFIVWGILSFGVLATLLLLAGTRLFSSRTVLTGVLILCLAVAVMDMRDVGSRQWMFPDPEGQRMRRMNPQVPDAMNALFSQPRRRIDNDTLMFNSEKAGNMPLVANIGIWPDWYFAAYVSLLNRILPVQGGPEKGEWPSSSQMLMGLKDGRRLFFSKTIDMNSADDFVKNAFETEEKLVPRLHWKLKSYDGDRLSVWISTPEPIYVSFIDNWDPDWRARVNGREAPVKKLLGTFKSVWVPQGNNEVIFSYEPFS